MTVFLVLCVFNVLYVLTDAGCQTCPSDEEFVDCLESLCRNVNCTQIDYNYLNPDNTACTSGCVCPEGKLRNSNGVCVSEDQCGNEASCPVNEEYSKCIQNIGRIVNCSQKDPENCPESNSEGCTGGCVCKSGYLRASDGTCVEEDQCYGDLTCKDNEIANSCPGNCNDFCPIKSGDKRRSCYAIQQNTTSCGAPKCACRFNSRRDPISKKCISTRDCPPFDCSARPNEEYNSCPPSCPSDDCSQASPTGLCKVIGRIGIVVECKPTCRCIQGYWRKNGICVPYGQCPGVCPANEEYSTCVQTICRAENCSELGQPLICADVDESQCESRCVCVKGTLRNENGTCVPEDQCGVNTQCDINEEFSTCTQRVCRPQECAQRNAPTICEDVPEETCNQGCVCVEGTYRDDKGFCVTGDLCPVPECGENERFNTCPNGCDVTKCPKSFQAEQDYINGCGSAAVCLAPQCQCIEGYRRNKQGICIPLADCPNICGANEVLSNCTETICGGQNCSQRGQRFNCPLIEEGSCTKGCVCADGYLRDENGLCIPEDQCPNPCGDNEVLNDCPNGCDVTNCPESFAKEQEYKQNCVAPAVCLTPRCQCSPKFRRDGNGTCIPIENCPNICGVNEQFTSCTQVLCRAQDCSQLGQPIACPSIQEQSCIPGCVCVEGTLRDESGACVPESQCPNPCDENEVLNECPNGCDVRDCPESYEKELEFKKTCVAPAVCLPAECQCIPNYRRDLNTAKCIRIENCPNICKENQEFSQCTQALCRAQNCTQLGQPIACPRIAAGFCRQGCVCSEGFLKDVNGRCIPQRQCPNPCGKNEILNKCPNGCDVTNCPESFAQEQLFKQNCVAPAVCLTPQCQCRPNFRRDENGMCIPIRKCPNICPINEEYSKCTQRACRAQNCSEAGRIFDCAQISDDSCTPGCLCVKGTLRSENGTCVPENQCTTVPTCNTDEVLNSCPGNCNDFCPTSETDKRGSCFGVSAEPGSANCGDPICACGFNYRRNNVYGTCIPTRECPPFDCSARPNEEYDSCPPLCPTDDCSQATPTGRCPLPGRIGIVLQCNPSCRCIKGYWRKNGTCVPYAECPNICPVNEMYSTCTQRECRAQNCSEAGQIFDCAETPEESCIPGCVCVEGTLRTENGTCVPENQCKPQPTCNQNEVLNSCPGNCNDFCPTSETDKRGSCFGVSAEPGSAACGDPICACRFNNRRNNDNGTCIPTSECPPFDCSARPNEEYDSCPTLCPTDDCSQATPTGRCPLPGRIGIVLQCNPTCRCIKGYWRNNGTCVPYAECPNVQGQCSENEKFSSCIQRECRVQDCSQKGQLILCSDIPDQFCQQGCVCVEGTLRNENGCCVPEDECPVPTCGENERLNQCPNGCDVTNCPVSYQQEQEYLQNCVAPAVCLAPQCQCIENYRRDANGTCIPIDTCPNICGTNENFSYCTEGLCSAQNCSELGTQIPCPRIETGYCGVGCVCAEGFLREDNGTCIPKEDCPNPCGENEFLNECPGGCAAIDCPESYQAELEYRQNCVSASVCLPPRCQCNSNYRRDGSGQCIPIETCPGICGVNEEFSQCTQAICRAQNCTQLGQPIACPSIAEGFCQQGCVCVQGTLRNEMGVCVPEDQCTKIECGPNEQYVECTSACTFESCPESFAVEQQEKANCVGAAVCYPPQCQCLPDYRRDENGLCIPVEFCPGICPQNEVLSNCIEQVCRPQTCAQVGQEIDTTGVSTCTQGCICAEGYLRNEQGVCVQEILCQGGSCPENEMFSECARVECTIQNCTETDSPVCESISRCSCRSGCACVSGTFRDDNGNCVPIEQCQEPLQCGLHEKVACVQECPPETTCRTRGVFYRCLETNKRCQQKCVCEDGYFRNSIGECITNAQCDLCPGNNEFFTCGPECDNECENIDTQNRTNCPILNIQCNKKCYCDDGYARITKNGECVPIEQCPKKEICGQNQYFGCKRTCPPETCLSLVAKFKCDEKESNKCTPGCTCRPGFLRLSTDSPCIPICECPQMKNSPDCLKKCKN